MFRFFSITSLRLSTILIRARYQNHGKKLVMLDTTISLNNQDRESCKTVGTVVFWGVCSAPEYSVSGVELDGVGTISVEERAAAEATAVAEDVNGNGELPLAESMDIPAARFAELLTTYDTDGDGELSEAERETVLLAEHTARKADLIAQYDVDGNGALSGAEREAAHETVHTAREAELIAQRRVAKAVARKGNLKQAVAPDNPMITIEKVLSNQIRQVTSAET